MLPIELKKTHVAKIIVLGEPAVGKTSLIRRYVENKFAESYIYTIGCDFLNKDVILKMGDTETIFGLQIWDIGGQSRFAPFKPMFFKGARGAILMYDLTRQQTLYELKYWLEDLLAHAPRAGQALALVGNKSDLTNERDVSSDEAQRIAQNLKCQISYETSAKTGFGVNEAFKDIAGLIYSYSQEK